MDATQPHTTDTTQHTTHTWQMKAAEPRTLHAHTTPWYALEPKRGCGEMVPLFNRKCGTKKIEVGFFSNQKHPHMPTKYGVC